MTHEEFIKWLDDEIEKSARNADAQDYDIEAVEFCNGYGEALKDVRKKFITLMPPPTTLN